MTVKEIINENKDGCYFELMDDAGHYFNFDLETQSYEDMIKPIENRYVLNARVYYDRQLHYNYKDRCEIIYDSHVEVNSDGTFKELKPVTKIPKYATLLLDRNEKFRVFDVHFNTRQVTLQENAKVFNTVSIDNVIFDFEDMSREDIENFENALRIDLTY